MGLGGVRTSRKRREEDYMDPQQGLCLGSIFDISATNGLDMGRRLCVFGFCRSVEMLSDVVQDVVLEQGGEVLIVELLNDAGGLNERLSMMVAVPYLWGFSGAALVPRGDEASSGQYTCFASRFYIVLAILVIALQGLAVQHSYTEQMQQAVGIGHAQSILHRLCPGLRGLRLSICTGRLCPGAYGFAQAMPRPKGFALIGLHSLCPGAYGFAQAMPRRKGVALIDLHRLRPGDYGFAQAMPRRLWIWTGYAQAIMDLHRLCPGLRGLRLSICTGYARPKGVALIDLHRLCQA
ncbi:hypothetical protein CBR_g45378 [Chara braunii]|uniref:DUF7811 domain-containing protein n=1 Tax=Chara braunii TaxID=69332 RepID=A0A388LYN1_CHABU|nr:hypothetical protein CBR_g45378 [Chara braunii]|eukprot:GBG87319.1 hypothetical protein CBR_g45378 [Chara braunii]